MGHEDIYKLAGECGYDGDDKINVSVFANRIAEEYEREIDQLKATIEAIKLAQRETIAWYITEKDMITQDQDWAKENSDMCQPLVIGLDLDNNEWSPDICDCDCDAKDNCELCTCGQAGYWAPIEQEEPELVPFDNAAILRIAAETSERFYKTTFSVIEEMGKNMTFPMKSPPKKE